MRLFNMVILKPKGSLLNLNIQQTLVYLHFTQHFLASPLPIQSNWWEAGNYYLDSAGPKTGMDFPQSNFFCNTKVLGEVGKKEESKVPWKDNVTWHEELSRREEFSQFKQGVTLTSIPKNQSPTHPEAGKEVCKHSSPPSSAGSSVQWRSCRKELWHDRCVTSSAVRREEKQCWLLSLRLHSCRYEGRNRLWGECPHSARTQLTALTMPFTPFLSKIQANAECIHRNCRLAMTLLESERVSDGKVIPILIISILITEIHVFLYWEKEKWA